MISLLRSAKVAQLSPKFVRNALCLVPALALGIGMATGCLDRRVVATNPQTSNVFVDQIKQTAVNKIDLLFMVDNSTSMADKQNILQAAVPALVTRLVDPICVDANDVPTGGSSPCTVGQPEFTPINDIHVGVVSSSLGARGGDVCSATEKFTDMQTHTLDDQGELIPKLRNAVDVPQGSGFLTWGPGGVTDSTEFATDVRADIAATGQFGCGFEAQLESWYRFLVDPFPPSSIVKAGNPAQNTRVGINMDVLAQRKAFLRPDSLVAIIMLSDENDCSITDTGFGWLVGSTTSPADAPRGTAACATNPNDVCCFSCLSGGAPPAGCPSVAEDTECQKGSYYSPGPDDALNERCYNLKQRYGIDLLFPTQRYVDGLSSPTVTAIDPTQGKAVTAVNPLYDVTGTTLSPRDPSLIFLAGIVGVPWQDLADDATRADPTKLNYLTADQMVSTNRWAAVLGGPTQYTPDPANPTAAPVPPTDPFMFETWTDRTTLLSGTQAQNPFTGQALVSAASQNPLATINGHEWNIPGHDDLQYACTARLTDAASGQPTQKQCAPGDTACDCSPNSATDSSNIATANNPLCQPPAGGAASTTQSFIKAYPGIRELQVIKDFGSNGIPASICPKNPDVTDAQNGGYGPAVSAIISRLKNALQGKCLPRQLAVEPDGTVQCEVIEAKPGTCDCTIPGRSAADPGIQPAVVAQLEASGVCGNNPGQQPCSGFCMCQIDQETGNNATLCKQDPTDANITLPGYCYIDDPNSKALANCPSNEKQLLGFVSTSGANPVQTPLSGSTAFIACIGAAINGDGGQ